MAKPRFAEIGSKKTFRAPYAAEGIRFYGFVVPADPDKLQRVCDAALNDPSGKKIDYRNALPYVLVSFTEIKKLSSTEPPDRDVGWVSEREAAFWMLTVAEKRELGVIDVAQRIAWYIPYIFVDSPNALLTGREVEGFPKEMGNIDLADPRAMTARAWAFPTYSPSTEVALSQVVAATRHGDDAPLVSAWNDVESAVRGIWKEVFDGGEPPAIPGISLLFQLVEGLVKHEVSLVYLKQFRDVVDSACACYQAIVETPIRVSEFRGGGLLPGRYSIDLADYDSHPIRSQLGIDPTATREIKGFWVDFDFVLEQGKVVWEAR